MPYAIPSVLEFKRAALCLKIKLSERGRQSRILLSALASQVRCKNVKYQLRKFSNYSAVDAAVV